MTSAGTLTGTFRVTDAFAGEVFDTGAYVNREGGVYQAAIVGDDIYVIQFNTGRLGEGKNKVGSWISSFHKSLPSRGFQFR